jgi:hypothetical protein
MGVAERYLKTMRGVARVRRSSSRKQGVLNGFVVEELGYFSDCGCIPSAAGPPRGTVPIDEDWSALRFRRMEFINRRFNRSLAVR